MALIKVIADPYIIGIGENPMIEDGIPQSEYDMLAELFRNKPVAPEGFMYMLRADTLEWELVEIQPEPEEDAGDVVTSPEQEQTE